MAAPVGNQFWKMRSSHGRNPIFATPDDLWQAACEYFDWVEANPLIEEKLFAFQGIVTRDQITKIRAMTIQGLCFFLDISDEAWADYCKRQDFIGITSKIKKVIFEQKFTGAAADLLNASIISRELGLDKQVIDHTSSDGSMSPHKAAKDMTTEELAAELEKLGVEFKKT